ncbi:MAG: serine/threonine protein kinase [Granulosicoccus sp.]|nr:serine/threonine protein kinase [Granulosicoccus sp.]
MAIEFQESDRTVVLPRIPGYSVHSVLGQGGFATVYLATQQSLNRQVALKIMNPAYASDADLCERFIREGHDLAIVSEHPSIVTVYDVGHVGNLYYIAMQYLPGPTLKQLLRSDKPYQHPLYIIRRIAEALAFAHAKGYVHRDIKPANILFNGQGEAVLSDFGIAKTHNRDEQLTQMGQLVGTELYMSREQALRVEHLDGRSDIYSLGVVFYETLTRRHPYTGTGSESVLSQHINAPVPQLPESEAQFQPLIDRMMAKNPTDRYSSADELIADIQRRYFDQPAEKSSVSVAPSVRHRWLLPGVLAVSAGMLVLALVYFLYFDHRWNTRSTISAEDQTTITESMELAELNELLGRIDQPPGSNAIELYELVLTLDPHHDEARKALERLRSR